MNQLKIKCGIWATPGFDFRNLLSEEPQCASGFAMLHQDCDVQWWTGQGYAYIGDTVVTVERPTSRDQIIQTQVAALRQMAQNERADGEQKARRIEERINQLLALENQA